MNWLIASLCTFFAGSILCLAAKGRPGITRIIGPTVTIVGGMLGLVPTCMVLGGMSACSLNLPWSMPFGSIALEMDALSAVFAVPILLVTMLAAVYGAEYLRSFENRKDMAFSWLCFNLLAGSMLLVVMAKNAILFLAGWETMSLSSFFLVMFESERENVRQAGWTYLVATHIGTAFLLVLFVLLGHDCGTFDFAQFSVKGLNPGLVSVMFLLAVIGFGTKAGFVPMHVWLPEAHPAAPSHVSAVMSGVMIKTGIYGLIRVLTFLGTPPCWWGWTLVGIGVVSGIFGIVFAMAQHDLKRLLAYSSVENIGIINMALGVGVLGMCYGAPAVAFLGFAGCFLHVINHAFFKSLLFLGAGSVLHASGTQKIDRMGGLMKRMPVTSITFLMASVAICGLPPLNGFVSEFMIYLGSLSAVAGEVHIPIGGIIAVPIVIGALALIGGLSMACFSKVFGMVFLGEPRSSNASHAHESGMAMRLPMALLAIACIIIGITGPFWINLLRPAISVVAGVGSENHVDVAFAVHALWIVTICVFAGTGLTIILALMRSRLLRARPVTQAPTWDCGYAAPSPRMQYTASSFTEPITRLFNVFLRTREHFLAPKHIFPKSSSFAAETPDVFQNSLYRPLFAVIHRLISRVRWIQHGRLNLYILYIVIALLVLLIWKLR